MANAIVNVHSAVPAAIQKLMAVAGAETYNELAGGVLASFPIISYRGKVWRIKKGGEEQDILNDEGDPVPSIEVVLVKSNPQPSKIYYAKNYEEGDNSRPDCWSADGYKPDSNVQKPVCKTCAACPNNVWGSKIAQNGNKTKACSDARRMVVVSKQELEEKGAEAPLYLLRTPPATLNPLKDYAEKVLKPKGIPYFAVTTKIGFDSSVAYPKMTFAAKRFLSDEEAEAIIHLRDSEDARRILAESEEHGVAGTPTGSEGSSPSDDEANTAAPATSAKKKAAKPRPADEEDVGLEEPTPPKKKAAAPVVEDEEPAPPPKKKAAPVVVEDDEEPAPPPKKKAAAPIVEDDEEPAPPPKKKAAPVVVEDDEEPAPPPKKKAPAPAAEDQPAPKKKAAPTPADDDEAPTPPPKKKAAAAAPPADEFEGMLDSILNG